MSGAKNPNPRSARVTLVGLVALFGFPLLMAWLMYSGVISFTPEETVNRGTLLEPAVRAEIPREFHQHDVEEHWVLLYPLPPRCDDRCEARLADLRQVHRALGRNAERLRIVILTDGSTGTELPTGFDPNAAGFNVIADTQGVLLKQIDTIEKGSGTFILDPLGNIMMHYAPDALPQDMKDDLERLIEYATTDIRQ